MISLCWKRVNVLLDADYDELNTYNDKLPLINILPLLIVKLFSSLLRISLAGTIVIIPSDPSELAQDIKTNIKITIIFRII